MYLFKIFFTLSAIFLITACNPSVGSQEVQNNDTLTINFNNSLKNHSQTPFYLTTDDIVNPKPWEFLEPIWSGVLKIENNCLVLWTSDIYSNTDKNKNYTFILPKDEYEMVFDKQNNILGFKNKNTNQSFLLNENIGLSGVAFDWQFNKEIPKNCPNDSLLVAKFLK